MKHQNVRFLALTLGLLAACSHSARAETVVLFEDFEAYTSNAQMTANWNLLAIGAFNNLDTTVGNSGNSLRMDSPDINGLGRLIRNLPGGPITADASTNIEMSVDMLLADAGAPSWNGARHFCELRSYVNGSYNDGNLLQLLALGVFNSSTNPFSTSFYQGRIAFGGLNWQTLRSEAGAVQRSTGWHNLKMVVSVSDIKFFVDDILSHVTPSTTVLTYDSAVLGGNVTAAGHTAWFDNFKVALVSTATTSVVDSYVIHNGWTGSTGDAVDPVKTLHLETSTPTALTYDNVINSGRGINGVGFDVDGLANPAAVTAADFVFEMSPQGVFTEPVAWVAAPAPTAVVVTEGTPDKVAISWANNAIANRWLRLTILANANTGLTENQVYYLGHLLGETTGLGTGTTYTVAFADITPIRGAVGATVDSGSIFDIDKNGTVAFADISAMRPNVGTQLPNITVPPAAVSAPPSN